MEKIKKSAFCVIGKALNSLSEEEQQFLNDVKADPANKAAEAEVIQ